MRIIISPAKKMVSEFELFEPVGTPMYMEETTSLLEYMRTLTYTELKELWKCNDKIAELNYDRIQKMDLSKELTPAILSYEGIQYQYMAPKVLEQDAIDYIEEHLRIVSGFYGLVKPLDGIVSYRLEMLSKLKGHEDQTLYKFWGDKLANHLAKETDCIVNLASKEYSSAITKFLPKEVKCITCQFGELVNGKVKEKSPYVKMARGEMVRFMAEEKVENLDRIRQFNRLGYVYSEEYSTEDTYVFLTE